MHMRKLKLTTPLLIAFAILISISNYFYMVFPVCLANRTDCYDLHVATLNHTADAPYRYRILAPLMADAIKGADTEVAVSTAYLFLHALVFAALFVGLYVWLRRWVSENRALMGLFITAMVLPLIFHHYQLSFGAAIEVTLLCWGLVCLSRMRLSLPSQA